VVSYAHRLRDAMLRLDLRPRWVTAAPQSRDFHPQEDFRFFAVLCTWQEEDIVEATVKNAFTQGVERVYLVDNASTDRTVERAVSAGARFDSSITSRRHDDVLRFVVMNALVQRVSEGEDVPRIWWLWLDADEFPHGPGSLTIREYLSRLDSRTRVVGATYFNHYPDSKPEYVTGFHPLDFQPLCHPFVQPPFPHCSQGHWKHPLQRFDREGPFLAATEGFHRARTMDGQTLIEPVGGIVSHHFPYREEQTTRIRLHKMHEGGEGSRDSVHRTVGSDDAFRRLRSCDAVYEQRWDKVDNLLHVRGDMGVHLLPWGKVNDLGIPARWYTPSRLSAPAPQGGAGVRSSLDDVKPQ
jgi:hypothetical protein